MNKHAADNTDKKHTGKARISTFDMVDNLVRKAESLGISTDSAQRALEELIDGDHIEDAEIIQIATSLFSDWQVGHPDKVPYGISLASLLSRFAASERCMQVVMEAGKAYKIDLASIAFGNEANCATWAEKCRRNACLLSDSFERLHSVSRCDDGKPIRLWTKYFVHALTMCETVPVSLLVWAASSDDNARSATCALRQMRGKTQGWPWWDRQVCRRLPRFTEQVMREVVAKRPNDVVACYALAGALEDQGRYHEARMAVRSFLADAHVSPEDECHLRHETLQVFRRELSFLKRMGGTFDGKVACIEEAFRADCEKLIALATECDLPKDSYLKTYALFEKDHCNAEHALALVGQMESSYTAQLVEGMIRNDWALLRDGSPLYDGERAIDCYIGAWEALLDEKPEASASMRLSVLCPLASALHDAQYYDDAIDVCEYALSLKQEPKLVKLLADMGKETCVRVGDDVESPEILSKHVGAEEPACDMVSDAVGPVSVAHYSEQASASFKVETKPTGLRKMLGILKFAS